MRLSGEISVRRGDEESVVQMRNACKETLAAGHLVMIFPESTRTADGSLGPFKDGAFQLAIATGAPILRIAVKGRRTCRPKGETWFQRAAATATILTPIETRGPGEADVPALRDRVRESIAHALRPAL